MGTRRNVHIARQHPNMPAVPRHQETMWTRVIRFDLWRDSGKRCAYCEIKLTEAEATYDHKVPRAAGGQTSRENGKVACGDCNQTKKTMSANAFKRKVMCPLPTDNIYIKLAHMRWRIERALTQSERSVARFCGVDDAHKKATRSADVYRSGNARRTSTNIQSHEIAPGP